MTLARVLTDMGIGMQLIYGLFAAAVMIAAASGGRVRRTGALPRGLVVAGFVIATLLVGFLWIPQFFVPLWVFAVGVVGLRRGCRSPPRGERTVAVA